MRESCCDQILYSGFLSSQFLWFTFLSFCLVSFNPISFSCHFSHLLTLSFLLVCCFLSLNIFSSLSSGLLPLQWHHVSFYIPLHPFLFPFIYLLHSCLISFSFITCSPCVPFHFLFCFLPCLHPWFPFFLRLLSSFPTLSFFASSTSLHFSWFFLSFLLFLSYCVSFTFPSYSHFAYLCSSHPPFLSLSHFLSLSSCVYVCLVLLLVPPLSFCFLSYGFPFYQPLPFHFVHSPFILIHLILRPLISFFSLFPASFCLLIRLSSLFIFPSSHFCPLIYFNVMFPLLMLALSILLSFLLLI